MVGCFTPGAAFAAVWMGGTPVNWVRLSFAFARRALMWRSVESSCGGVDALAVTFLPSPVAAFTPATAAGGLFWSGLTLVFAAAWADAAAGLLAAAALA